MDICVNLKKSLKRSKQFYIISFPQVWKFFWPRPQAPQARPWQERDHGMRYGREALGAKVIACQYLPALSLRGQPKAWKQRKASAPRQQRLWNTFHSLYNIYVYIYIFIYKYIYIFIFIYLYHNPMVGCNCRFNCPWDFSTIAWFEHFRGRICDSEKNINNHQSPKQHINNMT
jgi:hypothetical protein